MAIFDTLTALIEEKRAIEKREYEIWTAQSPLINSIRADIKAAFGKASIECFTDELLCKAGNRYLQLEHNSNTTNRFAASIVELRHDGDLLFAWKRAPMGDVCLGEVTANTFRYAFTVYSNERPAHGLWYARSEITLPLNGAIAAHGLGARLIALAERLLVDDRISQLETFNNEMFALNLQREAINADAAAQPAVEYSKELITLLNEENAELAELIHTMDFTYDYADRPSRASSDQKFAIRARLNKLPLNDAAALFVTHAGGSWSYVRSYLNQHPALAAIAA